MEPFFRRHFQQKAPGPGQRLQPSSGMGLPTGKARRRSPAGQASSSLAQRRRSSAQLQGCFPSCGVGTQSASRRRSSTAPPACNPRFMVDMVPILQPATIGAQLLGAPVLLAGLVGMKEEEGAQEGDETPGASSDAKPGSRTPRPSSHQGTWPLLPRCLRRASSHLLPANVVYGHTLWGLHGHYRRLSQRWPSGQHPSVGGRSQRASGTASGLMVPARARPLSRRRQVALRRKSAGPQPWNTLLM